MTVRLAELLAIGVVALLVGAALVYLLGSFFLMIKHVSPRPGQRHLAAMRHEFYYVLITQPLIPLYYVIGRRLGGPGEGIPVIFVHGYFQNRADFVWLAKQFRKTSKGPLYGFNYPWFDSVDRNVPRLAKFVEQTCAETGSDKVTLISHSLGGLVSLEFAHSPGGHRVAQCITIGTPHAGVKWRGPILGKVARELRAGGEFTDERRERNVVAPTLSVYSTHDNIVHPPSTCELAARGGSDVAIDGVGHLSLLYSPEVARVLIDFIDRPD